MRNASQFDRRLFRDGSRDCQIGLPLRVRLILLITCMITDRIGLHSDQLPLLICILRCALYAVYLN